MRIGVERVNHGMAAKPIQILLLTLLVATFASSCKRDSQTEKPESPKQPTTTKGDFLSFMHEGHAAAARWDQPGSTTAFRKALDADPTSTPARLNLGLAQLLDSKAEDAVATLKSLLDQPAVSTQLEYLYGLSLLKAGKPEDAIEHLRRASDAAPHESSVLFQYGVALQESKKTDEAATVFRKVIDLDRFHITAPFRLARIERVAGRTEEADRWMLKSEQNRAILGTDASDREARGLNRFTKPLDPPLSWEPKEIPDAVKFVETTKEWGFGEKTDSQRLHTQIPIAIIDPKHDFHYNLLLAAGEKWQPLEFTNGRFSAAELQIHAPIPIGSSGVIIADSDNDGLDDVLWFGESNLLFVRQTSQGIFRDSTNDSGLSDLKATHAIWVDVDHDGDVDLMTTSIDQCIRLYQNDGKGVLVDQTALLRIPDDPKSSFSSGFRTGLVACGDYNDDDSTDLLVTDYISGRILFNAGSYNFASERLPPRDLFACCGGSMLALDDYNNDGQLDAATCSISSGSFALFYMDFISDSKIPNFEISQSESDALGVPFLGTGPPAAIDYDSDGFLDWLIQSGPRVRLWRNRGSNGWDEVSDAVGLSSIAEKQPWNDFTSEIVVRDFDLDGDMDVLVITDDGSIRTLRNDRTKPANTLRLSLEGTKSNRSGTGARVDIRAGSARIFRNITSQPITIGVGDFEKLDLVKILWPNGATDAFTNVPVDKPLHVVETTVTLGSCPHLYVWNNNQFRFVTDILGNAPLGLPYAPGKYLAADTSEIVWLGNESNIAIDNGKIKIEITDELRELLYLDEVKLLVVDHPHDVDVHPNDKVIPPPFPHSEVWSVRNARPPIHAVDDAGLDVASRLTAVDDIKVAPRKLRSPQFKGLAETTSLTLDFGPIDTTKPNTLVMNGWLHWGGASSNIAAAQNPTLGNPFPRLEAMTADGTWQPVHVIVGAPSGKTKTILVDLTNKLPADTKQLRLTWGLEVFWDRIALAERVDNPLAIEIQPASANLYYRGVPRMTRSSPDQPFIPDYNDLLDSPPWRMIPEGFCTRFGDVLELLTATDDRYVIMNCGDACRIEFDVTTLPPVADGMSRDFFLYTDGWDKDMDHNVFTGHTVLPLPVHGQNEQSYGLEQFELPSTDWIEKYNTRWVPTQLEE